jgi:hypothetical protein
MKSEWCVDVVKRYPLDLIRLEIPNNIQDVVKRYPLNLLTYPFLPVGRVSYPW